MSKRQTSTIMIFVLVLACCAMFVAGCGDKGTASRDGVLAGHVFREGSVQPIYMAKVSCAGVTVFSEHDGSYELTGLPLGWQVLVVVKEDFREYREQVNITRDLVTHDVHIGEVKGDNGGVPEG